jgi:hypothetical protein
MRNIIRKILKEEVENLDQVKKGIDIAVKILKQTYPYIDGWRFDDNWNGKYIINIIIICDVKRLCEYYDSDLKPYYKNSKNSKIFYGDAAYPVSVLEIGSDMDSDEKWKSWKEFSDTLNDIYKLIPEDLKILDYHNDYKRLDPDRFEFR